MDERQELARRLRAYRDRNGLTIVQAAQRFGVGPRTWAAWEGCENTPRGRNLRDVKRLLDRDEKAA